MVERKKTNPLKFFIKKIKGDKNKPTDSNKKLLNPELKKPSKRESTRALPKVKGSEKSRAAQQKTPGLQVVREQKELPQRGKRLSSQKDKTRANLDSAGKSSANLLISKKNLERGTVQQPMRADTHDLEMAAPTLIQAPKIQGQALEPPKLAPTDLDIKARSKILNARFESALPSFHEEDESAHLELEENEKDSRKTMDQKELAETIHDLDEALGKYDREQSKTTRPKHTRLTHTMRQDGRKNIRQAEPALPNKLSAEVVQAGKKNPQEEPLDASEKKIARQNKAPAPLNKQKTIPENLTEIPSAQDALTNLQNPFYERKKDFSIEEQEILKEPEEPEPSASPQKISTNPFDGDDEVEAQQHAKAELKPADVEPRFSDRLSIPTTHLVNLSHFINMPAIASLDFIEIEREDDEIAILMKAVEWNDAHNPATAKEKAGIHNNLMMLIRIVTLAQNLEKFPENKDLITKEINKLSTKLAPTSGEAALLRSALIKDINHAKKEIAGLSRLGEPAYLISNISERIILSRAQEGIQDIFFRGLNLIARLIHLADPDSSDKGKDELRLSMDASEEIYTSIEENLKELRNLKLASAQAERIRQALIDDLERQW